MTNRNRARLLMLAAPLLCAMRDPFAPVADPCQSAQLSLWRYQGALQSDERLIGIVRRGDGQWQRVERGEALNTGWRVVALSTEALTVETGAGCEPSYWQWKREGNTQYEKDKSVDTAASAAAQPGEKRHSGGGRGAGGAGSAKPGQP